jgi:regulator of replication initiation timing
LSNQTQQQDLGGLSDEIKARLMQANRRVTNFNNIRTQTLEIAATDMLITLSETITALVNENAKLQNENKKLKQKTQTPTAEKTAK